MERIKIAVYILLSFICVRMCEKHINTVSAYSDDNIVTITVYESPILKPTKTITVERGGTIKLWIPSKEVAGLEGSDEWTFMGWYLEDFETQVSDATRFYENSSIYASWVRFPEEHPSIEGGLPGYEEELDETFLQSLGDSKPTIVKLKNIKGKKIQFQVNSKVEIDGYEIRFATNKKFKRVQKSIGLWDEKRITLKNMKKGKRYYLKVRGYKVNAQKKYYTKWSKRKSIKIKR
ncbi:MAG: hypothetical protein NC124_03295 [Clostridium sp.]|nr:hypothetical protein [Clostridium sp.]